MRFAGLVAIITALLPTALACNGYTGGVPAAVGTKTNSKVIEIAAGQTFDGKWYRYDRGSGACSGQTEGGASDAVFLLKEGATLRNVIIGKNQVSLIHRKQQRGHQLTRLRPRVSIARAIAVSSMSGSRTSVRTLSPSSRTSRARNLGSLVAVPTTPQTRLFSTTAAVPLTLSTFTSTTTASFTALAET